jgi:hypothetical protein
MEEDEICLHSFTSHQPWPTADTITSCQCLFHYTGVDPLPHPIVFKTSASDSLTYVLCTSVTIHVMLPDSQLQYFVHTSISMNHSQGVYIGIGVALVNCCY